MTNVEFSQGFDTRIDAFNEASNFGEQDKKLSFTEYEKSVFLTKAQEELIIACYTGKTNLYEGFEATEEIRRYLSYLVVGQTYTLPSSINDHHIISLDSSVWFIVYESLNIVGATDNCDKKVSLIDVVPVTLDELNKTLQNPFKKNNSKRALRVEGGEGSIDIIYHTKEGLNYMYIVKYIEEPSPIIVDDLSPSVDIRGCNTIQQCTLHTALHEIILDRAVQLAISSKSLNKIQS